VVPNEVRFARRREGPGRLGPNAGGKTVTLTSVGLCGLMTRAGLPIPADEGSKMPLFDAVHSSIGDAQSLKEGLSTFSAHVATLRDVIAAAKRGALVLVDEIAADTDPREGAAIAIAVLEELLTKGALVLVTTHLEELKALAHLDPRFVNARVGFDSRRWPPPFACSSRRRCLVGDRDRPAGRAARGAVRARHRPPRRTPAARSRRRSRAQDEQRKLEQARDSAEREPELPRTAQEARRRGRSVREEAARRRAAVPRRAQGRARVRARPGRELLDKLEASQSLKETKVAAKELAARVDEQADAAKALSPRSPSCRFSSPSERAPGTGASTKRSRCWRSTETTSPCRPARSRCA